MKTSFSQQLKLRLNLELTFRVMSWKRTPIDKSIVAIGDNQSSQPPDQHALEKKLY